MPRNAKILIRSGTAAPSAGDFEVAEPAWDKTNGKLYVKNAAGSMVEVGGSAGVSDGDKGDITVSASGATWTIDNDAVTYAKIQNVATDRLLGRSTAGSGDVEEITCTAAGRALLDDADAAAQRTTLGLGTLAGANCVAVFTALDNQPPASGFATLDTRNSVAILDFDAAATESAVFVGIMPEVTTLANGLVVRIVFMATSATSGDVRWSVAFERGNTDLDSDSFATAAAANVAVAGTSGIPATASITITTIDSIATGDLFRLRVQRIGGDAGDTATGDAELIAVEVRTA